MLIDGPIPSVVIEEIRVTFLPQFLGVLSGRRGADRREEAVSPNFGPCPLCEVRPSVYVARPLYTVLYLTSLHDGHDITTGAWRSGPPSGSSTQCPDAVARRLLHVVHSTSMSL
jgi:hypothetical protein